MRPRPHLDEIRDAERRRVDAEFERVVRPLWPEFVRLLAELEAEGRRVWRCHDREAALRVRRDRGGR